MFLNGCGNGTEGNNRYQENSARRREKKAEIRGEEASAEREENA